MELMMFKFVEFCKNLLRRDLEEIYYLSRLLGTPLWRLGYPTTTTVS